MATTHGVVTGGTVLVAGGFVLAHFTGVFVSDTITMHPAVIPVVATGLGLSRATVAERRVFFFECCELLIVKSSPHLQLPLPPLTNRSTNSTQAPQTHHPLSKPTPTQPPSQQPCPLSPPPSPNSNSGGRGCQVNEGFLIFCWGWVAGSG